MKTNDLSLSLLRNEEHVQFHTDFKSLVETSNAAKLKIEEGFAAYLPIYNDELEALDIIRKSAITDDIAQADTLRDSIFRGMCDAVKSALRHFSPDVQKSASCLNVVLDHYGNVTKKPYDEETAAINSMLIDLNTKNPADIAATGLAGWLAELQAKNDAFDTLKKNRYTDEASKTSLRMKQVRIQADAAYHAITSRINALIIVNGETAYIGFVNELNKRIESYSNLLAQRKGRNAKVTSETITPTA